MIRLRRWLAERLLDVLVDFPVQRGKYRLAQLGAFLLDGVPIRSRYGPQLHTRFADSTFWLAARYGNDEVMSLLSDLSSIDGFIDVGANIGLTTCFAQPRCAAVLSLEASSRELADLQRNCALLNSPLPTVLLAAAAERPGFLPFRIGHISHSGGNSLGTGHSIEEQQLMVQAVRLDDLLNSGALSEWPAMH
jgi:FkbM family methyltransferase